MGFYYGNTIYGIRVINKKTETVMLECISPDWQRAFHELNIDWETLIGGDYAVHFHVDVWSTLDSSDLGSYKGWQIFGYFKYY